MRDAGLSVSDIAGIIGHGKGNMRQAIDSKASGLRHEIEMIRHKLQTLHNLSDLCDADGDIVQMNQAIILAICRCSASHHSPAVMMR